MNVNRFIRVIAGAFIIISVLLGYLIHPGFFLFTLFVGANLLQSGLTKWCFMETILKKLGVPE